MYTELNMWEAAQQLMESCNQSPSEILKKKAETLAERKDVLAAAATYEEVGDYMKAVQLLGEDGHMDQLLNIMRNKLTANDTEIISKCTDFFKKHKRIDYAIEAVQKLGDVAALLSIYVDLQQWDEAFKIAEFHPGYSEQVYIPYGNWLALNDRFEEAQECFTKAGRPNESIRILKFLVENAVYQRRFKLAGKYYWTLACETLKLNTKVATITQRVVKTDSIADWKRYKQLAEIYYAYSQVYKFVEDPFTLCAPEVLMNAAKFVLVYIFNHDCPAEISKVYTLYCLGKIAFKLRCYKTSKYALDKLLQMKLPQGWNDTVQLLALLIKAKPAADPEEFHTVCFQCSYTLSFMNTKEMSCTNCLEPHVLSFYSFGHLPMIQFSPDVSLSEEEVLKLLQSYPPIEKKSSDDFYVSDVERQKDSYSAVIFSKQKLLECDPHNVFIRKWPSDKIPNDYFLLVSDDVHVVMCPSCQHFFEEGEWNYQVLLHSCCPFCKHKVEIV
jgi:intraflagellar transport protein 122